MKWLVKLVGHCKAVAPIWDELGQKYSEKGFQFDLLCSGTRSHIQSIFTCCRLNIIKMITDPPLQVTWSSPSWTQPRMRSKGWTSKDFQLSRCSRKKPTRKLNMSVGKRYYVYLQRGIKLCFQDKKNDRGLHHILTNKDVSPKNNSILIFLNLFRSQVYFWALRSFIVFRLGHFCQKLQEILF